MKSKKVVEDKSAVSLYDKHIVQGESWDWDSTVQLFSAGVFATTTAVSAKGLKGDVGEYRKVVGSKGKSNLYSQSIMLGDDWNNYFRETYGYENVNWETAFDSPIDIIEMPSSVTRMNPKGLYNYLGKSSLDMGPLGRGENAKISFLEGGGYNAHFRTQYGNSYIQYNPSSIHHSGEAYYKVSSGKTFSYMGVKTGIQRFNLDGGIMHDR